MQTTVDELLRALGPNAPPGPVKRLRGHLGRFDKGAALAERLDWLEELGAWVLTTGGRIPAAQDAPPEPPTTRRLRLLLRACEQVPEIDEILRTAFRSTFVETSAVRLLSETGLPGSHGFLRELSERAVRRFLPAPRTDRELSDLVPRVFVSDRSIRWLVAAPRGLLAAFATRIAGGGDTHEGFGVLRSAALDAIELLSMRVAVLGLADDVRTRGPETDVTRSPFRRLQALFREMVDRERTGSTPAPEDGSARAEALRECRAFVREVLSNLDRSGVSVDLVYRLELTSKSLLRLERLSAAVSAEPDDRARAAADLFVALLRDAARDRSVRALVHANLRQLSKKIVERAGESGEHYITSSREEWREMLGSAAGGGLLTVGTTVAKFKIYALHLPPFFDGLAAAANYGASFVVMQLAGFTLATKQPSMTAAALAHELSEKEEDDSKALDLSPLVDQIERISRSQLAAAAGNLLLVVFAACLIESVLLLTGRDPLLEPKKARQLIESLHPFGSGTIFFAALTGVLLWASSVGAGWFENWAVYQRIPEGLAASWRLRRVIGASRAERFATWFAHHLSGFGGNLTLGFLLGMTPVFGAFFGLPLDVRHVTLSSGSLAFAGLALVQTGVPLASFAWAVLGIALIGLLNFGVSFALALEVALRARDVDRSGHWQLATAVGRRLLSAPRNFVLPPRDVAAAVLAPQPAVAAPPVKSDPAP